MLKVWPIILFWCVASGCVSTQPQPASAETNIDTVLDKLQVSGQNLHSFAADLKITEGDETMGTDVIRLGHVWFLAGAAGDATLHVVLDQKQLAGKTFADKQEYLLDDGVLTRRTYASRKENRSHVSPPGEKMNLFQLGKGPFPLPIGQDKKDVHQQFDVIEVAPAKDDPANTVHLQLTPKPETDLAKKFFSIDVWVDLKNNMSARIMTLDPRQATSRTTDLINLLINPVIAKADLDLPPLGAGWTSVDDN